MTKQNFEKIDSWLKENAHRIAEFSLQGPATDHQLDELEKTIKKEYLMTSGNCIYGITGLMMMKILEAFFMGWIFTLLTE